MKFLYILAFLGLSTLLSGQEGIVVKLWPNGVPKQQIAQEGEIVIVTDNVRISNVQDPTIEVFLPDRSEANGQAVIICPGGSYKWLSYKKERVDMAKKLNAHGIAGIVLKYRLPNSKSLIEPQKAPLMDAGQAMRIVRSTAEEWGIDVNKVGVMGFSAGGHLDSTLATHFSEDIRPDFAILVYPVISMKKEVTHGGSRRNLLGENPDQGRIEDYSNEFQVSTSTPPTFLVHASNDKAVVVKNSLLFYEELVKNDVTAEMHLYPTGGHGFGLALGKGHLSAWSDRLMDWLASLN
ncbi:alpha/beta hydrolase [Arenibacter sp. M-2]|uniref:alpha/beta hydrolase n=1 Tax=Arenibacter sp. M-2 TaxID=3053612 RepID=UPI00257057C2|nr:alpha/beta hydrolase [Arenibacter sp. M-2]MDL5511193.1 alpha/beta hydrolase [Arenibacter sp. M-2]